MPGIVRFLGTRKLRWRALYLIRELFRMVGRGWNDFYAWMLDFQDRHVTLDQILRIPSSPTKHRGLWDWRRGEYFLQYMRRHGLQPSHRILDYGCGYGRGAIPILKFQETDGHYIGTEISKKRMALAQEWIEREGLTQKSFELVLSKENLMPFIPTRSIDVAWVHSVFNHMPDAELDKTLKGLARVLRPGGMLFCHYSVEMGNSAKSVKNFYRQEGYMTGRLQALGFQLRHLSDWDDDLGPARPPQSRMILATVPLN